MQRAPDTRSPRHTNGLACVLIVALGLLFACSAPVAERVTHPRPGPSPSPTTTSDDDASTTTCPEELPRAAEAAVVAGAACPIGTPPPGPVRSGETWWRHAGIDHTALRALLGRAGFWPPRGFRAFVIEITFDEDNRRILEERAFDWKAESDKTYGWNVASSIKIFAAIAALKRMRELGFSPDVEVVFHRARAKRWTLRELVRDAIVESGNMSYNRLVQLAGYDWLNESFFTRANGFTESAINEAYDKRQWRRLRERESLAYAPAITLREGWQVHEISRRRGESEPACGSTACTSLIDLAEAMRRIALQEYLPPEQHFGLHPADLALLRDALSQQRERGERAVEQIRTVFPREDIVLYHKPGYSQGWTSDVIYLGDPAANRAWVIAMTGAGGRRALKRPAFRLTEILAYDDLRKTPAQPGLPDDDEVRETVRVSDGR